MKAGIHAIIMKINEEAAQHGGERYAQIKNAIDQEIDGENALYREESGKQHEVLRKHNEHEYKRRLEYQRSRLNRELLVYQHELTDEIFDMAVVKLREVSDEEFTAMFKAAVKGMKGRYTLHLGALSAGKLDSSVLEAVMEENAGLDVYLSSVPIRHKSGFVLRDDRVEYDHLFEDLVEDMKSERAASIMKEVFGNSGDWMFSAASPQLKVES